MLDIASSSSSSSSSSSPSSHFEVWHGNGEEKDIYYVPYEYSEVWALERRLWNPSFVHRMFTRHWHFSIYIVLLYVTGVHYLRRWMQDRKPFELATFLVFWNSALAIFSFVGAWRFGQEFVYVMRHRTFQDSVCLSIAPDQPVAFWAMCFALSKVAEFGDTILLVLRKRPLIFLHWFHHAVVLIYSWHSATELTAAGRWFIQLNYMVHAIMYSYYALTSAGARPPKWAAMCVTSLQTTQMLIGVFISLYVAHLKWRHNGLSATKSYAKQQSASIVAVNDGQQQAPLVCQQSIENMCICFAIYSAFAFLFIRFFVNAYLRGKKAPKAKKEE